MKKIKKLLAFSLMFFILSGCIKVNASIEITSDKKVNVSLDYLVEESLLTMSGMTVEDFFEQMESEIPVDDGELDNVSTKPLEKKIDGAKWVGLQLSAVANVEDIGYAFVEKEIKGTKSFELTIPMKEVSQEIDLTEIESYGYSVEQLKKLGVEMTVSIKMPGKVTSNFGEVKGNTVTIDLLDLVSKGSTKDIVISSPATKTGGSILTYILVGLGAVVIVGGVFLLLKKRKTAVAADDIMTDNVIIDNVTTDDVTTDDVTTDDVITDDVTTDDVTTDEVNTDEVNTDEVNTDEVNTDDVNTDEVNTDDVNTDDVNTDEVN